MSAVVGRKFGTSASDSIDLEKIRVNGEYSERYGQTEKQKNDRLKVINDKFLVELQEVVNDGGSFTLVAAKDASGVPS